MATDPSKKLLVLAYLFWGILLGCHIYFRIKNDQMLANVLSQPEMPKAEIYRNFQTYTDYAFYLEGFTWLAGMISFWFIRNKLYLIFVGVAWAVILLI